MTAFDNSKMIVLTGGVRTTSTGVTPAELAAEVDALEAADTLRNQYSTRVYADRATAVADIAKLTPGQTTRIITVEGQALCVRAPFQNGDDPLSATSPYWGVVLRQDVSAEATARAQAIAALHDALSAESTARANADTALATEFRDGREWTASGSMLTPSGIDVPEWAITIRTRSTYSNEYRQWRRGNAPADGIETDVLVKANNDVWLQLIRDADVMQVESVVDGLTQLVGTTEDAPALSRTTDSAGQVVDATDLAGDAHFVGLGGRSVRVHIAALRRRLDALEKRPGMSFLAAPHLMQFVDAKGAAFGVLDKVADIQTGNMPVGLGAWMGRMKNNMEKLALDMRKGLHLNAFSDLGCSQSPSAQAHNARVINEALQKFARNPRAFGGRAVLYLPDGMDIPLGSDTMDTADTGCIRPVDGLSIIGGDQNTARLMPYGYWAALFRAPTWPYTVESRNWLEDCMHVNFTIECENQIVRPNAQGGQYVGTKGTYYHGYRNSHFLNVNCFNSGMTGLGNDFADHCLYYNCHVVNGGRHPRATGNNNAPGSSGIGLGTGWQETEVQGVVNCVVEDCWNYGTFVEKQADNLSATNISRGAFFIGNVARNNRRGGIGEAGCYDTIITANQVLDSDEHGIIVHAGTISSGIAGQRPRIDGNVITGCGGDGIHYDSTGKAGYHGIRTNGNTIDRCETGISITGYDGGSIDDWALRNDDITNCRARGIDVVSGRFTNFDIMLPRLINNGTLPGDDVAGNGGGIQLGAAGKTTYLRRGRIFGGVISDVRTTPTQTESIVGAASLQNFTIKDVDGFGCAPIALTGAQSDVTITDNIGV